MPRPTGYCPREGYKVASQILGALYGLRSVTVPVRGIRLHPIGASIWTSERSYCPREGYKVASGLFPAFFHRIADVTVPVRGIRLHLLPRRSARRAESYCPREGYKVASRRHRLQGDGSFVTVPVRGIRLHHHLGAQGLVRIDVTVPVRGIRLHPHRSRLRLCRGCYCPREGYKVASPRSCPGGHRAPPLLSP